MKHILEYNQLPRYKSKLDIIIDDIKDDLEFISNDLRDDGYIINIISNNTIGTKRKKGMGYNIVTLLEISILYKNNSFFNFDDNIVNFILKINDYLADKNFILSYGGYKLPIPQHGDWVISNFKIKDDKLIDNMDILTSKDRTNSIKIIYKSI